MPRTHPPYAAEYRRRIVELARGGRSITALAREFEATVETSRQWGKQAGLDEGLRSDGLTTTEREELTRLRRENRVLREEREILAKAAAWFAQETGSTPARGSGSEGVTRPCIIRPQCAAYWASPPVVITRGSSGRLRREPGRMANLARRLRRFINARAPPTGRRG